MVLFYSGFRSLFTLSTPDVRFPLLDVTRFTANALASKEVTKRRCKAFTLLYLFSFCAFAMRTCSFRTLRSHLFQSMPFQPQDIRGCWISLAVHSSLWGMSLSERLRNQPLPVTHALVGYYWRNNRFDCNLEQLLERPLVAHFWIKKVILRNCFK